MRQVKRLFYMVLLNVLISAITVGIILQLWERDHPPIPAETTPVIIVVTPTQVIGLPIVGNNAVSAALTPLAAGPVASEALQAPPTMEMLTYRVKEGDTLGALSVQFNISIGDIMSVNGMTDPDSLYVGQIIYIPTSPLPSATPIPPTVVASATLRPSITPTRGPTLTASPTLTGQEAQVFIDTVIGAGVLENERVVLRRTGNGELSLSGWRLMDGRGHEYTFPQLTLYEGGAINLNTRTGQDTVVDLFWGLTSPIWSPGDAISVYDDQDVLRTTYTVP
jgi:LysM repeat protein